MNLLLIITTIVLFIASIVLTIIVARKHTKPNRSYVVRPNIEGDISLEDALKYLKLVNLK